MQIILDFMNDVLVSWGMVQWSRSWSQCYEMLHSCYQRLRPLTPHIWWQFNDWLDNLSWNFFYLKNWLLLKYFNWHRCWAALTGRCGHGSCFMTKYKTIFSIVFCAQLSPVQLRLSAPSDGWWRCDRGQIALALAAAASYHKHHTSTLASNSLDLRHYLGWIMGCLIPCKMKSQFSWATLTLECKSMTCQTCGTN